MLSTIQFLGLWIFLTWLVSRQHKQQSDFNFIFNFIDCLVLLIRSQFVAQSNHCTFLWFYFILPDNYVNYGSTRFKCYFWYSIHHISTFHCMWLNLCSIQVKNRNLTSCKITISRVREIKATKNRNFCDIKLIKWLLINSAS